MVMQVLSWRTWRHDIFVGLLASCLTAAVLGPLGWVRVRDARQEAQQAREAERAQREQAEQGAAKARQNLALMEELRKAPIEEALKAARKDLAAVRRLSPAAREAAARHYTEMANWPGVSEEERKAFLRLAQEFRE